MSFRVNDAWMERMMGRLLQTGVLMSSLFVLVGGVLFLREHGGGTADYHVFASEPAALRTFHGLAAGLLARRPEALIQLGVLVLIATPVARVLFALFSFAAERDRLYVTISLVILVVLVFGFLHPV